jgi:hypothetical protein
MRYFYALMVWMSEFELAIARSTGRNPAHVRQLQRDLAYWQHQQDLFEVRRYVR